MQNFKGFFGGGNLSKAFIKKFVIPGNERSYS